MLSNGHALDAALRAAAPHRLRPADERAAQLPPAAQQDAGPPRGGRHAGRRDHHRPAGPGHQPTRWAWRWPRSCWRTSSTAPATRSSTTAPTSSSATAA
ncbi:MAG: hypothetical protein MZW92_14385 [Comamonadaceae bacterium]|nr:hypothetical protein [Comamonadaceae bacterium]